MRVDRRAHRRHAQRRAPHRDGAPAECPRPPRPCGRRRVAGPGVRARAPASRSCSTSATTRCPDSATTWAPPSSGSSRNRSPTWPATPAHAGGDPSRRRPTPSVTLDVADDGVGIPAEPARRHGRSGWSACGSGRSRAAARSAFTGCRAAARRSCSRCPGRRRTLMIRDRHRRRSSDGAGGTPPHRERRSRHLASSGEAANGARAVPAAAAAAGRRGAARREHARARRWSRRCSELQDHAPEVRVLVLSVHPEDQ